MNRSTVRFVSQAMSRAGAPSVEIVSSATLGVSGFFLEENSMSPAELGPVICPVPSAGMVVSSELLTWNWQKEGRDYRAQFHPGNICTSPGGEFPRQWWADPVTILTVCFEPEFLYSSVGGFNGRRSVELPLSPTGTDMVMSHLFWALHSELRADFPGGRIVVEAIASALAAALCRRFRIVPTRDGLYRGGLSRTTLKTVIDFIREHPGDNFGIKELAQLASLSHFHFCRQFKISTGQTVHDYVLALRMERAKHLLSSTDTCIAEIAYKSGLANLSHFSTAFKKYVGVTPAAFRREVSVRFR